MRFIALLVSRKLLKNITNMWYKHEINEENILSRANDLILFHYWKLKRFLMVLYMSASTYVYVVFHFYRLLMFIYRTVACAIHTFSFGYLISGFGKGWREAKKNKLYFNRQFVISNYSSKRKWDVIMVL